MSGNPHDDCDPPPMRTNFAPKRKPLHTIAKFSPKEIADALHEVYGVIATSVSFDVVERLEGFGMNERTTHTFDGATATL